MPSGPNSRIHIVGQGLAGSILGYLLHKEGFNIRISDNSHKNSSSMVAAGMWNPLSFKNLHQSWYASKLLPDAADIYTRIENELGISFYHPLELVRIFPNQQTANEWDEKSDHPEVAEFISNETDIEIKKNHDLGFGHGIVKGSGWLNIPIVLNGLKKYFIENGILVENEIDSLPEYSENELTIFCTGYKMKNFKGLDHIPIRPNKGQVLTISTNEIHIDKMLNFGKFLISLGNEQFRMGATYELDDPNPMPTEKSRNEILEALRLVHSSPVNLINELTEYRPTTPDRKPIIGFLPDRPDIAVFNGFGSKGVMLIPYFARLFVNVIKGEATLSPEVMINRYYK